MKIGLRRQDNGLFFITGFFQQFKLCTYYLYLYTNVAHTLPLSEFILFSFQSHPYYYQPITQALYSAHLPKWEYAYI